MVFGESSTAARTAATSSRVTRPRGTLPPRLTRPVPALLREPTGTHHGRVEPARTHCVVRAALCAQIHTEGVIAARVGVRPHAADDHVAAHPGLLRRRDQLHRAAVVHRLLALGPAPGTGAGGEHDRVGAGDRLRDSSSSLACSRSTTAGSAPACLTSSAWSGLRIRATASSPRRDKTVAEAQGDLAMTSGDGYSHGPKP